MTLKELVNIILNDPELARNCYSHDDSQVLIQIGNKQYDLSSHYVPTTGNLVLVTEAKE